jgi:hypothetical protein
MMVRVSHLLQSAATLAPRSGSTTNRDGNRVTRFTGPLPRHRGFTGLRRARRAALLHRFRPSLVGASGTGKRVGRASGPTAADGPPAIGPIHAAVGAVAPNCRATNPGRSPAGKDKGAQIGTIRRRAAMPNRPGTSKAVQPHRRVQCQPPGPGQRSLLPLRSL